jgi:uncharacterized protein (TIGR03032 family)
MNETTSTSQPNFELTTSRQFISWLKEQNISLCFSTYQTGKVFLLGHNSGDQLSVFERTFDRPMGMWSDGQTLLLSCLYQIHQFKNSLESGDNADGYDRLFVPQISYITGDLDIHDLAMNKKGQPVFINTSFGCLATSDAEHSFQPLWKPPFISQLSPEDRCHLNGLAMKDGEPAYVTAVAATNITDGWRDNRRNGGIVMEIDNSEIIANGLSMPHSPRWHNGKLYLANSGTGEFGHIDLNTGQFEAIAFCPGYIRGVAMHGDYAILGLSRPRYNKTFNGLELNERLEKENIEARSVLFVVDLKNGGTPHWLRAEGFITELYDVIALAGVARPSMIGYRNDQIRRVLSMAPFPT